jgi:hypothetical protein
MIEISNYNDIEKNPLYCKDYLAEISIDCICNKTIGLDARTGLPIVDNEESEYTRE